MGIYSLLLQIIKSEPTERFTVSLRHSS